MSPQQGVALDPLDALRRPPDPMRLKKNHAPLTTIPGSAPEYSLQNAKIKVNERVVNSKHFTQAHNVCNHSNIHPTYILISYR